MAGIIAGAITGGAADVEGIQQISRSIGETLKGGQAALLAKNNNVPKAYLNYIFFDAEMQSKSTNFTQVTEAAHGSFEQLEMEFIAKEEGYLVAYTSNQTNEDLNVFMDDMTVTHTTGPIVRVDDYYPFGLTFNSSKLDGKLTNKFLYNGVELQNDLELNTYQTLFRTYDPEIGRFQQIDPMADFLPGINPYNFGFDNPVSYADPTGLWPRWLENLWGRLFKGMTRTDTEQRKTSWNNKPKYKKRKKKHKGTKSNKSTGNTEPSAAPVRTYLSLNSLSPIGISSNDGPVTPDINIVETNIQPTPDPRPPLQNPNLYRIPAGKRTLSFSEEIYFNSNSDKLYSLPQAEKALDKLVRTLKADPKLSLFIVGNVGSSQMKITGNSSEALDQSAMLNGEWVKVRDLMNARAKAIYRFLIRKGIDAGRLNYGPGNVYKEGGVGRKTSFELRQ